jgi:hypothetical protein
MDIKKVDELLRMKGNCAATVDILIIELLSTIANNTARLIQIEQSKLSGQMELDLEPKQEKVTESKQEFKQQVEQKVQEAIEKKSKDIPPHLEEVVEKELPTEDKVREKLVDFIQNNSEEALANILKELGDYANFPAVPQEKYPELLNKIA